MSKRTKKKNKGKPAKSKPFTAHPLSDDFLHCFKWKRLRYQVLKKYGATCQCCGSGSGNGVVINVDHIKPRKLFPHLALDVTNLQVLCDSCNYGKGNSDTTDWRPSDDVQFDPMDGLDNMLKSF